MTARYGNAALDRLDDGLNAWSTKWILKGNGIMCVQCWAAQPARCADETFRHVETCRMASDFTQLPWRELADLLTDLPLVKA